MRIIAMIPARYQASRFPGKLMKLLGKKTIIHHTWEAVKNTGLFEEVYIVTDSEIIFNEIQKLGGAVIKSIKEHKCGSDRIAEAAEKINADIVVNVQGDEPLIDGESLKKVIEVFKGDTEKEIDLASLMTPLHKLEEINNPNNVKVIVDRQNFALYFSRMAIPYNRDNSQHGKWYKHKGVYAFRRQALLDFSQWEESTLEATEKIEAIRYLEYGKKIKMVETEHSGIEIDTPQDLVKAREIWS